MSNKEVPIVRWQGNPQSLFKFQNTRLHTVAWPPNDPKLSDARSWRGGCAVGERRRLEAAAVTAERVRCSAWLGDVWFMV